MIWDTWLSIVPVRSAVENAVQPITKKPTNTLPKTTGKHRRLRKQHAQNSPDQRRKKSGSNDRIKRILQQTQGGYSMYSETCNKISQTNKCDSSKH
ncbi:hypothetical protein HN011_009589 [Eciton burchellii]|nr:hypothetical protein HN011_009589 [Eciton burchellii]